MTKYTDHDQVIIGFLLDYCEENLDDTEQKVFTELLSIELASVSRSAGGFIYLPKVEKTSPNQSCFGIRNAP